MKRSTPTRQFESGCQPQRWKAALAARMKDQGNALKSRQLGQFALASAISAAIVLGVTACAQSNTIDFVYVTSANTSSSTIGDIYGFAADGESGALSQVNGSPFPSGGRNPIAILTAPNGRNVYALNHDDNTVVEFIAGTDGALYAQNTYNPKSGTNPNGMAISPDGKTLYVVEGYGLDAKSNPFSATTPGVGALVAFPIGSDGSLGPEVSYATCNNPVAVATTPDGSAVYVVNDPAGQLTTLIDTVAEQNRGATGSATVVYPATGACSGGTKPFGQISTYAVNSDGSLSTGAGSPYTAGAAPVGIAVDPQSHYTYVIDYASNLLMPYSIQAGGALTAVTGENIPTGQEPSALTFDPTGAHLYVTNYGGGTVSGYALDAATGAATALPSSGSALTGQGPAALVIESSFHRYMYTADFVASTVSGLYINGNDGTTQQIQHSPFGGVQKATAVSTVTHNTKL